MIRRADITEEEEEALAWNIALFLGPLGPERGEYGRHARRGR